MFRVGFRSRSQLEIPFMKYALLPLLLVALLAMPASAQKQDAPNFSLKDGSGKTVELTKLRGKAVVVNFWATWCPPCKAEIPGFVSVYKKFKDKGLEIVGVSLDEKGWGVINPFLKKHEIPYPVVLGDMDIAKAYGGIRSIPTTFFVDRKGKIADQHVGYMSQDDFEKKVKAIL